MGVWYDSVAQTMAIDRDRIREALAECEKFVGSSRITLHALQKFLGRLYHANVPSLAEPLWHAFSTCSERQSMSSRAGHRGSQSRCVLVLGFPGQIQWGHSSQTPAALF